MNSYVPGVPLDFDLMQLSPDELVFLPGLYSEDTDVAAQELIRQHTPVGWPDGSYYDTKQLHLAEAFALEHNRQVFRQKTGKRSSP